MGWNTARRASRRCALTCALAAIAAAQLAPAALASHINPGYEPGDVDPSIQQHWAIPGPDDRGWQSSNTCSGEEQPGTRNLLRFLNYHWPRGEDWGIYNCRPPSLHAQGRAVDFHLDIADAGDKAAGDQISLFFRRSDSGGAKWAMARRFGIQEIIWNCRIWTAARAADGWRLYSRCDPNSSSYTTNRTLQHKDHIHVGQNWGGARQAKTAWTGYHYCYTCLRSEEETLPPPDFDTGDLYDPLFPDPLEE